MLHKDLACGFHLALTPIAYIRCNIGSYHFAALVFQVVYILSFLRYRFCIASCLAQEAFIKWKQSEDWAFPFSYQRRILKHVA